MSSTLTLEQAVAHAPLPGVEVPAAAWTTAARSWLPLPLLGLIAELHRELEGERQTLLARRRERQAAWDQGELPGYLDDEVSRAARGEWQIAPLPPDLERRRVEITGPVDSAKMVIQMLSRGEDGARADCAMLDFEDSMKPEWPRVLAGFANLAGAARGDLAWRQPAEGGKPEKVYRLDPADMPVVMVRCRGLHLDELNLTVDGEPVAGGLLDLAGAVYHSAEALLARGRTPKYYVPKCEHHLEARWWGRLFTLLEERLGLERGCLRVTLLIETLPAAFQMEEILWQLRERITALNVGRWDKIFSDIKTLKAHPDRVLADRATISLERPWMRAYAERLIAVCHRHGAFGMGGMAAFTPGKTAERRAEQIAKVVADKRFEHALGHDGCWVSHPYFIAPALSAFPEENQLAVIPQLPERPDLLPVGGGPYTEAGLRKNLRVGIAYLEGWRRGLGCVAWDDLMEDLATLEISRAQTWQWLHHRVRLDDGREVTPALVRGLFAEEESAIAGEIRAALSDPAEAAATAARFAAARAEAEAIFTETELRPFLALASERMGG
ncbi:MAG TPA: malate synthase A [Thermoanaerobaculia bacterium]|nr:malate synthase A [Thermoanaerobaculia bacterium]